MGREPLDAGLQHVEELHARQRCLRVAPVQRVADPMAVSAKQVFDFVVAGILADCIDRNLAPSAAKLVDDLVLEDADDPGRQLRLAAEALATLERRDQRLGDRIFGPCRARPARCRDKECARYRCRSST